MADETPTNAPLLLDRGEPVGSSLGDDNRRRAHVLIANKGTEPIPVSGASQVNVENSYSGALAAGASFAGQAVNVLAFPETTISLAGAPNVAPGTLIFEFSPDGATWDVSVPYALTGPNAFVPLPLRNVLPWFRVRYVNGATPLTGLRLTTLLHRISANDLTRVLNQVIDENEPVKNVRAFIGGKSPDGPFTNLPAPGIVTSLSTTTPLAGGATFNAAGVPISTAGFVAVGATLTSDRASASMGVVFQWFKDSAGLELLKESTFTYDTPGSGIALQVPVQGPYLRLKYTNGAVAQATFRLSTRLSTVSPPSDVLAISGVITGNTAAQIVKANVVGQREDGVYDNVRLSNSASLKVAVTDRPSEVRGRTRVVVTAEFVTLVVSPGTLVYTVPVGKIFYLNSVIVSAVNNANAIGRFTISDNLATVLAFVLPEKAAGTAAGTAVASPPLPEPIPFLTSIRLIEQAGDVIASITLVGYLE